MGTFEDLREVVQEENISRRRAAIEEMRVLDNFIASLRGRSKEEVTEVLSKLEPAFVQRVLDRMIDRVPEERQAKVRLAIQSFARGWRPRTRDELYEYVVAETGYRIPRKSVCQGHCAPFDFLADIVLEEGNPDKLAVGNRGSGKTQIVGIAHAVNWKVKPNHQGATVGAVQQQAFRCYGYFREVVEARWLYNTHKGRVLMSGTGSKIKSSVQVLTGTISGVNSPHPHLAHLDEVELLKPGVYEESLNMAQSSHGYVAQNILTSSWKKPSGLVTKLRNENREAREQGLQEPYQEYVWCVWETTEPCVHDCDACPFADTVRGKWEDGTARTFESACKRGSPHPGMGKLKFTDGFVKVHDAVMRFRKLSRRMWDSQQESRRPTSEGLVYSEFDADQHTTRQFEPLLDQGTIDLGMDFGGTNPHACLFMQHLAYEVELEDGRRLPEGSTVIFDEVYIPRVGNIEFGRLINRRIDEWEAAIPGFREAIEGRFRDPAASAAARDLAKLDQLGDGTEFTAIHTTHTKTPVDDSISMVRDMIRDNLFYIDERCTSVLDEIGSYEENPKTHKPEKEDDHAMDAMRYVFWNRHVRRRRTSSAQGAQPRAQERQRAVIRHRNGNGHPSGNWEHDVAEAERRVRTAPGLVETAPPGGPRSRPRKPRGF